MLGGGEADTPAMDCASCNAEIEPADRYCPACRLPNLNGTRIPRFGPAEREPGPIIAPRVLGAGQRPCPRCTGGVRRRDRYCRSCGLDVSRLPPPPVHAGRRITSGSRPGGAYRPLRPSTAALRLVVGLIAVTGLVLAGVSVVVWRRLGGEVTMIPLPETTVDWAVLQTWVQGLAVVQLGLLVLASVMMIRWTAQGARNVPSLRVGGRTIPAVWATVGWLIPFVNLVLPRQVVAELWRSADPQVEIDSSAWKGHPAPTLLNVWWICTLVAFPTAMLAGTALVGVGDFPPSALGDLHNARSAFVLLAVAEGLLVFAAVLFARVLSDVTDRQTARMDMVERGTTAPPTLASARGATAPERVRVRRRTGAQPPVPDEPTPTGSMLVHYGADGSPIGRY